MSSAHILRTRAHPNPNVNLPIIQSYGLKSDELQVGNGEETGTNPPASHLLYRIFPRLLETIRFSDLITIETSDAAYQYKNIDPVTNELC